MDPVIFTQAHRLPPVLCPVCAHTMDACTGLTGTNLPAAGDYTVCAECVSLLQFGSDRALRQITISDVVPDRRELIQKVLDAGLELKRQRSHSAVTRTGFVN